jgi:hypothetical protein
MNFDMQQNDTSVQEDIRSLDDDELCHVQGGLNMFDIAKVLMGALGTLGNFLNMASGRPQV